VLRLVKFSSSLIDFFVAAPYCIVIVKSSKVKYFFVESGVVMRCCVKSSEAF
jgi:hypothetical protein